MALEKATIEVLTVARRDSGITVLFNPDEYTSSAQLLQGDRRCPGLSGPLLQFVNGEADVLTMELFLDDYTDKPTPTASPSVQQRLERRSPSLLEIDRDLHAPPPVRFIWGPLNFSAIIEKLSRKITLFQPDGTPARATLSSPSRNTSTLRELHQRPAAAIGRQDQAPRRRRPRQPVGDRRARIRRPGANGGGSPSTTIWTTRARSRRATG